MSEFRHNFQPSTSVIELGTIGRFSINISCSAPTVRTFNPIRNGEIFITGPEPVTYLHADGVLRNQCSPTATGYHSSILSAIKAVERYYKEHPIQYDEDFTNIPTEPPAGYIH